jgi:small-conductance mechanosensitive channel
MTDLHIPLDTPREKVEKAVAVIGEILADHEGMDRAYPPRVYFDDFNPDSFNIKIAYWYQPPNIWDFYAFSQRVNLAIFHAFDEQGIQFSLPFRITHTNLESEPGPLELKMVADRESDPKESAPPTHNGT